jgi:hypothetical protein
VRDFQKNAAILRSASFRAPRSGEPGTSFDGGRLDSGTLLRSDRKEGLSFGIPVSCWMM